MRLNKAIDIERQTIAKLEDINRSGKTFSLTQSEISMRYNKVMSELPKGTPRHVIEYCRGYWQCLHNQRERNDLRFMYSIMLPSTGNKTLLGIDRGKDDYYEKHGVTPEHLNNNYISSGLYWNNTEKPYFIAPKLIN